MAKEARFRGKVIYEPGGPAREYAELAATIYTGCDNRCAYCFAPEVSHKSREDFHRSVGVRPNLLQGMEYDLKRMTKGTEGTGFTDKRKVLLSFMSDPVPNEERMGLDITKQAIVLLHSYGYGVTILSKNGTLVWEHLKDVLCKDDQVATTLVFLNDEDREIWEPNAAPTFDRINMLSEAHSAGIPTWVSFEPTIDVEQSLTLMQVCAPFVQEFRVGMLNHQDMTNWPDPYWQKLVADTNWYEYYRRVLRLVERGASRSLEYLYIKKSLRQQVIVNGGSQDWFSRRPLGHTVDVPGF